MSSPTTTTNAVQRTSAPDTFLIALVLLAFYAMPFDRDFSFHLLSASAVIALVVCVIRTRGKTGRWDGLVSLRAMHLIIAMLVMIIAQAYWFLTLGGQGRFAWMSEYAKETILYWSASSVLCFYFANHYGGVIPAAKKYIVSFMLLVLALTLVAAFKEYQETGYRVALKIRHPVPAGFVFTIMTMVAVMTFSSWLTKSWRLGCAVFALAIGATLVVLTSTRGALIIFLMFLLVAVWSYSRGGRQCRKGELIGLSLMSLSIFLGVLIGFYDRFADLYHDLMNYWQDNPSGSMGGRFVMWEAGWYSFLHHPWGYTSEARYQVVHDYISARLPGQDGLIIQITTAAAHHLHNELIEAVSLQGVFGLIAILWLYATLIGTAWKAKVVDPMFGPLVVAMLIFGVNEPLFNSNKIVLCLALAIPLCVAFGTERRQRESRSPGSGGNV